jgi:NAD(P)-dependent dehydrogenase (short-subunit alcohol dehydrogenase family)
MEKDLGSSLPSLADYSDIESISGSATGDMIGHNRSATEGIDINIGSSSTRSGGGGDFAGKVIVITGAGGQFGRTGCIYFCRHGARVAGLDQSKEGLKETFTALEQALGDSSNFDFKPYVCDVTDAKQMQDVIDSIDFRFKRIDLLWNNAGYQGKIIPMLDYDPDDFKTVMDINVVGMFIVMQAVAKKMKNQHDNAAAAAAAAAADQGGQSSCSCAIVNTASVAALRGTPAMIAYASSKAAVLTMTVTAAKELAQYNIRVNAISPALIGPGYMWDRQNELHAQVGAPFYAPDDPEQVAQNKIASVPMKRLGSVEEVIKVVAFLLSDHSSYMTGTNLVVDGGMAAGLKA